MNYAIEHKRDERKDQAKSAVITFLTFLLLFLLIYFYKIIKESPLPQEQVTTMLINFGDNQNGTNLEEPANQEGSVAPSETEVLPQSEISKPQPVTEKIITGKNVKVSAPKVEKAEKTLKEISKTAKKTKVSKTTTSKTSATKSTKSIAKASGDGRGNTAIGNLIKGRGNKSGSQGTNGSTGNAGDPLGGDGNGDSKIGIDRKLIGFIPGTMGRGGNQPSQKCTANGTIQISYTVDKAGNVVSARRSSGISDPCVVSTSVNWVKKYVKAEKANTSSTGTYKITF
ncbi:ferric siderophore ABC transporter substrate-binding protein [Halpernia sp.]|uniref:ferric siderophore ABC transporter substrate-binding protein n=1 Tax=Halpernia sp. TaxID=2782209 RepID=UPI003A918063